MFKFKQGDLVQLTAAPPGVAAPQMIVLDVVAAQFGNRVRCFWFSQQQDYCEAEFPETMLELVDDPSEGDD